MSCQRKMLLACSPICKTISVYTPQVLMDADALNLNGLHISNVFRIRKPPRLLHILTRKKVEDVGVRKDQSL